MIQASSNFSLNLHCIILWGCFPTSDAYQLEFTCINVMLGADFEDSVNQDAGRGITVPSTNRAITWPRYYRYIYLCDIKCHKLAGSALKHPLPDVSITPSIACSLYNSTILIQSLWLTVLSDKNQQEFLHPSDKTWQGRDLSFWGAPGQKYDSFHQLSGSVLLVFWHSFYVQ